MIEQLLVADVLSETGDGHYEPSPEFVESFADRDVAVESDRIEDVLGRATASEDAVDDAKSFLADDEQHLAIYLALDEWVPEMDHLEKLQALSLVRALRSPETELGGVPKYFFPVPGDLLGHIASYYERAIVYVWGNDCTPCDTVKSDFEAIFDAPPDDVALLSVYGPNWASLLYHEYDVVGGPTTLFMANGSVDARLVGAHPREALVNEIEILREEL